MGLPKATIDAAVADMVPATNTKMPKRERDALGGTMAAILKKQPGGDKKYAIDHAWTSYHAHGTILGLREVARAMQGAQDDFILGALRDGMGAIYLIGANVVIGNFIHQLVTRFGISDSADQVDYAKRNLRLAAGEIDLKCERRIYRAISHNKPHLSSGWPNQESPQSLTGIQFALSGRLDSNQRSPAPQTGAITRLRYGPMPWNMAFRLLPPQMLNLSRAEGYAGVWREATGSAIPFSAIESST